MLDSSRGTYWIETKWAWDREIKRIVLKLIFGFLVDVCKSWSSHETYSPVQRETRWFLVLIVLVSAFKPKLLTKANQFNSSQKVIKPIFFYKIMNHYQPWYGTRKVYIQEQIHKYIPPKKITTHRNKILILKKHLFWIK